MNKGFLERLFLTVSAEQSNPCDGYRLDELYKRIPDTANSRDVLDNHLEALSVDLEVVCDELAQLSTAYEWQGFRNGFRLGIALWNELNWGIAGNVSDLDTWEDMGGPNGNGN